MTDPMSQNFTAFDGHRRIGAGPLHEVALAVKRASREIPRDPLLIFDDSTGRVVDVDLRGTDTEVTQRLAPSTSAEKVDEPRGRGRPKLGVVGREVTLLPRHWDWLNNQPGGASVALRRLVEDARKVNAGKDERRRQLEVAYKFMSGIAGDLPGFEEATRALFADDEERFKKLVALWPVDVRYHAVMLGFKSRESRLAVG